MGAGCGYGALLDSKQGGKLELSMYRRMRRNGAGCPGSVVWAVSSQDEYNASTSQMRTMSSLDPRGERGRRER